MSAPLSSTTESQPYEQQEPLDALPVMAWWVRGLLVAVCLGLLGVFTLAVLLHPYNPDGTPRDHATHTTPPLNLPPCTFYQMTGVPCPSCGMTTSFSLLMHGDPINSLRANWVGTLLASFCLLLIPWSLVSVYLGRPLFVSTIEPYLIRVIIGFLVLLLGRWAVLLLWVWWTRH